MTRKAHEMHDLVVKTDDAGVVLGVAIDGVDLLVPVDTPIEIIGTGDGVIIAKVPVLVRSFRTEARAQTHGKMPWSEGATERDGCKPVSLA